MGSDSARWTRRDKDGWGAASPSLPRATPSVSLSLPLAFWQIDKYAFHQNFGVEPCFFSAFLFRVQPFPQSRPVRSLSDVSPVKHKRSGK